MIGVYVQVLRGDGRYMPGGDIKTGEEHLCLSPVVWGGSLYALPGVTPDSDCAARFRGTQTGAKPLEVCRRPARNRGL